MCIEPSLPSSIVVDTSGINLAGCTGDIACGAYTGWANSSATFPKASGVCAYGPPTTDITAYGTEPLCAGIPLPLQVLPHFDEGLCKWVVWISDASDLDVWTGTSDTLTGTYTQVSGCASGSVVVS